KRVTGQQKLQGALPPSQPWQPLRAAKSGRNADIDLRLCKGCLLARDRQMNRLGDLAAGTKSNPVDSSDDRLWKGLQSRRHGLTPAAELANRDIGSLLYAFGKFVYVAASREGTIPGPGHDHGSDGIVLLDTVEEPQQKIVRCVVKSIQFFRAV